MPNLVGPAFNLFSPNRNRVHLRKENGLYFSGGEKNKNCSFFPVHQRKQLAFQIVQILWFISLLISGKTKELQ
jgi:hypothetical protein